MAHTNEPQGNDRVSRGTTASHQSTRPRTDGSSAPVEVKEDDDTTRDSFIGTDRGHRAANVSWGAIFAGVVIFLAILVVFALINTALGLSAAGGVAVGIWTVIGLLVALAAAGYVAGALAVRGGLLHGLTTWAASLVGLLLLIGWVGSSLLGTIGGAIGGIAQTATGATNISAEQLGQVAENVDPQDVEQAQQQAEQAAQDAQQQFEQSRDEIAAGAWWGVAGLVLGAVVAGFAGVAGARSAHTRRTEVHPGAERRLDQ